MHSGPGMGGSLKAREGRHRCFHTNHLSAQHCAILESADAAAVKDCPKEGRSRHILNLLGNLEVVDIVARKGPLGDPRRCLGVGFLQKAVVGCLEVHRKVVAGHKCLGVGRLRMVVVGHLKVCHRPVVSWGVLRKEVVESCMVEIGVGSGRTMVVKTGAIDSRLGHIGLAGEGCIVYERFR